MTNLVINVPGEYVSLGLVMQSALEQASKGKGKERHASEGEAYEDQIICEVARRVGLGYPLGQAVKKIYESQRIGGDRGVAELLGAINYIAAAIIVMREGLETAPKAESGCFQNGNGHSPEASAEPEFQRGDKVEVQMVPDSSTWASAAITAVYRDKDTCEWRYCVDFDDGWTHVVVPSARVRPVSAPKAEGCEEPAYNPDNDVVGEVVTLAWPRGKVLEKLYASGRIEKCAEGCEELVQKDAPQTAQELYQHIVDCNPATFKARTPTGEELAEMAEEEGHG